MKAVGETDNLVLALYTFGLAELANELQSTFVGFCTGVGKEDFQSG